MQQSTADRMEAVKQFVITQVNAIRQDPNMSDAMYSTVLDSVITEFTRFMEYAVTEGAAVDYNIAFDAGYTKALEHVESRRKGAAMRAQQRLRDGDEDGLESTTREIIRRRYRISLLTLPGHRLVDVPAPLWSAVRNAARQMKHRLGREYRFDVNARTGLMTVTLVRLGAKESGTLPDGKRKTLAYKLKNQ